jgi:hypothetical protein
MHADQLKGDRNMLLTVKSALEIANVVRPDIHCKFRPVWDKNKEAAYEYENPECAIKKVCDNGLGRMPVDFIEIESDVQLETCSFNVYYRELTNKDDLCVADRALEEALRVVRTLQRSVKTAGTKDDARSYKDVLNNIYGRRPWTVFDVLTLVNMTQWVKIAIKIADSEGKKKTMLMEGGVDILLKQEMLQHYVVLKISVGTEDSDTDLFIEAVNENDMCE